MENLVKSIAATAIDWQQVGVQSENVLIPPQRLTDREYIATFPAFLYYRQRNGLDTLALRHSSQTPTAATRWVGQNYSGYKNPEFDALVDRYFATVPKSERLEIARQAVRHISEQLPMLGLHYDADALLVSDRIMNLGNGIAPASTPAWNAHLWDVKF
jgi:peptide/nickel transport system substrate-binding protein